MSDTSIYSSIAERTRGDIYIGVVGPVRTGKSTFIKRFMDVLVLPNMEDEDEKQRAVDEMPQSSHGRTIMTTEPKFIPEKAAEISIENSMKCSVRLIDCVGYVVPAALGYIENEQPRMVRTPWFEKEIPFNMAAEIGTKKVITEHSTIGIAITSDGTVGDIPEEEYCEAEERVIEELKGINKPFVLLLNSAEPMSERCLDKAERLRKKHGISVFPVNCKELSEDEIKTILAGLLYEFPLKELKLQMPRWISKLPKNHPLRQSVFSCISESAENLRKVKDAKELTEAVSHNENIDSCSLMETDLSQGGVKLKLIPQEGLFYKTLSEKTGITVKDESDLMERLTEMTEIEKEFKRFKEALSEVEATGYGIVMPTMKELKLEEPEIVKQGGRYGVRLKASAPSIHMMKANITTEVAPIVGTESRSEEMIMYLLKEFEENPSKIWESNIFGKSLNSLVNEGLHTKLYKMPTDARVRIQETLERVINEGCSGLICIIL